MKIISGQDTTKIICPSYHPDKIVDLLATNRHLQQYPDDIAHAYGMGIATLRVGVPWHRIEAVKGKYDWAWFDSYMIELHLNNIEPILDPLHHISFPDWLVGGFSNNDFADQYSKFFFLLMARYPHVSKYTIINEPLVTCLFTGKYGIWYPFEEGDHNFLRQLRVVARVIYVLANALQANGKQHYWADSCESHINRDGSPHPGQKHRFLLLDILMGRMTHKHSLWEYVRQVFPEIDLRDYSKRPMFITAMGLDYYPHSEFEYVDGHRVHNANPRGFASVAFEYAMRYRCNVWLGETNIRGEIFDRIKWFNLMYLQSEILQKLLKPYGHSVLAFCWYPLLDTTDWHLLVRSSDGQVDPTGIIWLSNDEHKTRHIQDNPFVELITNLNIDGYSPWQQYDEPFRPPLDRQLDGFERLTPELLVNPKPK